MATRIITATTMEVTTIPILMGARITIMVPEVPLIPLPAARLDRLRKEEAVERVNEVPIRTYKVFMR
jgi:hypothetical protein